MRMIPFFKPRKGFMVAGGGLETSTGGGGGGGSSFQYSTDEFDTGKKWTDGRTIYGKVFTFDGNITATSREWVNTNASFTGKCVGGAFIMGAYDNMALPIGATSISNTLRIYNLADNVNTKTIYVEYIKEV